VADPEWSGSLLVGAHGLNVSPVGSVKIPEGSKFPLLYYSTIVH